jgi:hypothetical protein
MRRQKPARGKMPAIPFLIEERVDAICRTLQASHDRSRVQSFLRKSTFEISPRKPQVPAANLVRSNLGRAEQSFLQDFAIQIVRVSLLLGPAKRFSRRLIRGSIAISPNHKPRRLT